MDRNFSCNQCGTSGSFEWMKTHNCQAVQDVRAHGGYCEDYPCCGHPPGECMPQESFTKEYWLRQMEDGYWDPEENYHDEHYEVG